MSTKKSVRLDFQIISTGDPKYISLVDYSQWGLIEDKPAIIEVTVAGASTPVVLSFTKNSQTIFTTKNLLMTCNDCSLSDFPDGIYTFTLKGSPDTFNKTRKFLKTDLLRLQLDKFIISTECNWSAKTYELYNEINFLIAVAEAHTRYDNLSTAQEFLQQAYDKVDRLINC